MSAVSPVRNELINGNFRIKITFNNMPGVFNVIHDKYEFSIELNEAFRKFIDLFVASGIHFMDARYITLNDLHRTLKTQVKDIEKQIVIDFCNMFTKEYVTNLCNQQIDTREEFLISFALSEYNNAAEKFLKQIDCALKKKPKTDLSFLSPYNFEDHRKVMELFSNIYEK